MNSGLNPSDPTLVAAFRSALLHQGAIAVLSREAWARVQQVTVPVQYGSSG
jgi:hypothetical protein